MISLMIWFAEQFYKFKSVQTRYAYRLFGWMENEMKINWWKNDWIDCDLQRAEEKGLNYALHKVNKVGR